MWTGRELGYLELFLSFNTQTLVFLHRFPGNPQSVRLHRFPPKNSLVSPSSSCSRLNGRWTNQTGGRGTQNTRRRMYRDGNETQPEGRRGGVVEGRRGIQTQPQNPFKSFKDVKDVFLIETMAKPKQTDLCACMHTQARAHAHTHAAMLCCCG